MVSANNTRYSSSELNEILHWYPGEIMDPTSPDACASQAYAQYDENEYMVRYLDFEAEEDRSW